MGRWDEKRGDRTRRERELRASVVRALKPLHGVAVENPALPGTPDVSYADGWIELKCWPHWPRYVNKALRIDHWTPQQRVFHRRRSRASGEVYVLIEIAEAGEFLLLEGGVAAEILGKAGREVLRARAVATWTGGKAAMTADLVQCLRARRAARASTPPPADEPLPET